MRSTSSSSTAQPGAQQQSQSQGHQKKPIYFGPFEVTNQVFLTTPHSFALVNLKPLLPGHVLVCPLVPHRRLTDLSPVELTDLFTAVQRVQRMLARHYFLGPASSSSPSSAAASLPPPPPPSPPSSSSSSSSTPSAASQPSPPGHHQQQQQQQHDGQAPLREGGRGGEEERGSFNIALQDGPEAGQTVAHVHVHVIPRIRGATAKPASTPSDAIYEQMAAEEGNVGGALWDRDRERQRESGDGGRPVPGGGFPRIEDAARVARGMEEMEEEAGIYRRVLEQMEAEGL
ncbi:histidine triad-like protein [Thermothelomyces thermophilus ATCC 42464]|uniref:Bis(5'-adenosyl)-triphosphatase n=1 Tax=Thermothelomyces thermophilus (strain ATCC 42464 / BCRC 31852 / DSM 1799) TaxID=573729 RepID=G2Q4A8_THET4|nr:histidine triad-like protein [Thermothelomyces thermophilus ATCC 42464]AEO55303.1 histidine triad-like protein [Thermothelomyces thermophilus ATCC 42464]